VVFYILDKVNVMSAVGAFYSTESLCRIVLLTPKGVSSFISRGAEHQRLSATSASEGRNYRCNLAKNTVIHVSVNFFSMPQTWDMGQILILPLRRKAC
jgi:hypothetical protein